MSFTWRIKLLQLFWWLVEVAPLNQLKLSQQMELPSAHFLTSQIKDLHTLWIITSCVEDIIPDLHVFVTLLGSGRNTEMTLRLIGLTMRVGVDKMVNFYSSEVQIVRKHQKWFQVLVIKRVLTYNMK